MWRDARVVGMLVDDACALRHHGSRFEESRREDSDVEIAVLSLTGSECRLPAACVVMLSGVSVPADESAAGGGGDHSTVNPRPPRKASTFVSTGRRVMRAAVSEVLSRKSRAC